MITHNLSKSSLRWLIQKVMMQVRLSGLTYQDVMYQNSKPTQWAFLPRVWQVYGRTFIPEAPELGCTLEHAHLVYRRLVADPGRDDVVDLWLSVFPGERGLQALSLNRTSASLATEFALALSQHRKDLVIGQKSFFTRKREKGKAFIFGIHTGMVERKKADLIAIQWMISPPANRHKFPTYDVIDKLCDKLPQVALPLTALKEAQEPWVAYELEQELYNMPKVFIDTNLAELKYSAEMLALIKGIITDQTQGLPERVEELTATLVPDYMTEEYLASILPIPAKETDLVAVYKAVEAIFKKANDGK